ncbi:HEAT repeat domain-containing protein [Streptomyces xiangluensis]|uniref:HEAT repeat domain-containing protein n=1 Tax=Streptomyces xiangluensis TaxID=2665720 RepID=A0ABV8YR72_9ACTN
MLRRNKSWVVSRAAGALFEIAGPGAVTALATALDGAAPDVRVQLAYKLGQTKDAGAVAPLVALLRARGTADAAANALGQIGDAPAVTALVDGLVSPRGQGADR